MPLRLYDRAKPAENAVSPWLPIIRCRKPFDTDGVQLTPMDGARLFQSGLNARVPFERFTSFGATPGVVPGLKRLHVSAFGLLGSQPATLPEIPQAESSVAVEYVLLVE